MLDFKELSKDGQEFELLTREILFKLGYHVYWSGKGQDAGKDLICEEEYQSIFQANSRRWLIQCKHNAHSGKSVGITDLDDISNSCIQHQANGYVLVCSTHPSSTVVERLEGFTANKSNDIIATYWDSVKIERVLSTVKLWSLAQRFFPISANIEAWKIYATDLPNYWIVNYSGYHFHIVNRIGSNCNQHLSGITKQISRLENIKLPEGHFIRIRAIYYDDKHAEYIWYLDYMEPDWSNDYIDQNSEIIISEEEIQRQLGHDETLDDGQTYYFDIRKVICSPLSDHYDQDHYDYYIHDRGCFLGGLSRRKRY
jgi:hypothetical protein